MYEFFAMEGRGIYIWPAYAATVTILLGALALVLRRNARVRRELVRVESRRRRPEMDVRRDDDRPL